MPSDAEVISTLNGFNEPAATGRRAPHGPPSA